ncbi:MAG: PDZ domain-containing protein [Planctomycetota bacterium]
MRSSTSTLVLAALLALLPTLAEATFSTGSSRRIPLNIRTEATEEDGQRLTGIAYSVDSSGSLFLYRSFVRTVGHLGVGVTELGHGLVRDGEEAFTGLRVTKVDEAGPAYEAGIRSGDVLLSVDDRQLSNPNQFPVLIKYHALDKPVRLQVQRGHDRFTVDVTLLEKEEGTTDIDRARLSTFADHHTGTLFGEITGETAKHFFDGGGSGVVVMDIKPGSPAFYSDLRRGDLVTAIGDVPVDRPAALDQMLAEHVGRDAVLAIRRGEAADVVSVIPEKSLSEGFHFQIPIVIDVEKRMQRTDFELVMGMLVDYDRHSTVTEDDEHHERYEFGAALNLIHYRSDPHRRQIRLLWFIKWGWRR